MGLECPFKSNYCSRYLNIEARLGNCQAVGRGPELGNQSGNLGVGAHQLEAVEVSVEPGLCHAGHFCKEGLQPSVEVIARVHDNAEVVEMQGLGGTKLQSDGQGDCLEVIVDGRFIVKLKCGEDLGMFVSVSGYLRYCR